MYEFYKDKITHIAVIKRKGNWSGTPGKGFHDAVYIKADGKHYLAHFSTNEETGRQPRIYQIDGPITENNPTWTILKNGKDKCNYGYTIGDIMKIQDNTSYKYVFDNCETFANKAFDLITGGPGIYTKALFNRIH